MATRTEYDEENKIWSGPEVESIFHPNVSVGQVVLYMLGKTPNTVAQIFHPTGAEMKFSELRTLSIRAALHLQKFGLSQDDIIGICASNTPNTGPLALGALIAGIPFSSLDPTFGKNEIKHCFGITKPKIMFCDGSIYKTMKESLDDMDLKCPIYTVWEHIEGVPTVNDFLAEIPIDPGFQASKLKDGGDQIAVILCSSGTTGPVKGVGISNRALIEGTCLRSFAENHVMFSFSTLYWGTGLVTLLLGALSGGTRIITDQMFTPELFLEIIEKYKVTFVVTSPSIMAMTLSSPNIEKTNLSSIKIFSCGGSAVPDVLMKRMRAQLKTAMVSVSYGMTEICQTIAKGNGNSSGGIGMLAQNSRVMIIDDDGNKLGVGEAGEICLQSKNKWPGYYNNPQASKEIYVDGWIHSGDIGFINKEGILHIIDRKKDILKYQNYQVYPTEIELIIAEIPDVVEVCVCGLDDIVSRDLPSAAIVKKPNSELSSSYVCNYVANKLAFHKHLHGGVYFVDSLPKAPSSKVQRRNVKIMLEEIRKNHL